MVTLLSTYCHVHNHKTPSSPIICLKLYNRFLLTCGHGDIVRKHSASTASTNKVIKHVIRNSKFAVLKIHKCGP